MVQDRLEKRTQPQLGFLAVEVDIHRPPGDPFNELTWPFPLIKEKVVGSRESQIVSAVGYDDTFIERFVVAAKRLADRGAIGVITSCGFLVLAQQRLSARIPIPISTSALVQLPSIRAILTPSQRIGILTYDGDRLTVAHLDQVRVDAADVVIRGCQKNGHLRGIITRGEEYDGERLETELVSEARALIKEGKNIGALLLECTQMPPYAEAIQKAVHLPVYDVYTMGLWFYAGLSRRHPAEWN